MEIQYPLQYIIDSINKPIVNKAMGVDRQEIQPLETKEEAKMNNYLLNHIPIKLRLV
jgi:hypothetical protein